MRAGEVFLSNNAFLKHTPEELKRTQSAFPDMLSKFEDCLCKVK